MANKSDKYYPYFDGNTPIHKLSYCAFLDVLGFKHKIEDSYEQNSSEQLLQEYYQIFNGQIEKIKADTNDCWLFFKCFSDNVLLAHPQFSDDMEAEFGFILWSIQEFQLNMAVRGFFIRGGLSLEQLFMGNNMVYGKALIEAHNLENTIAENPMVILSDSVKKIVNSHLHYYKDGSAPQYKDILIDMNGSYFINYLQECIIENDESSEIDLNTLSQHKNQINSNLELNRNNSKVYQKMLWLASYHNYFCDMVEGYPNYSNSLKINLHGKQQYKFNRLSRM